MKIKIGLEIHVYLNLERLRSKLFCDCSMDYLKNPPNTNICPRCTGMPGNKPLLPNKEALEKAAKIALILNCKLSNKSLFQRKHYDWPDLPNGYQKTISGAYSIPLGVEGKYNGVKIWDVHLEEDPAKWDPVTGTVDYNRSGMPLVEIVTAPDLKDPNEARAWLRQLLNALNYINAYNKELGVKADVNVSIEGHPRVEVKNVNSFWSICRTIEYEVERQKEMLKEKKKLIEETRTFDDKKRITKHMRFKETQQEYMFIPEPDLPTIFISDEYVKELKKDLPESPEEKFKRFKNKFKLDKKDAEIISKDLGLATLFEEVIKTIDPKYAARWFRVEILRFLNMHNKRLDETALNKDNLIVLFKLVKGLEITDTVAKSIIEKLVKKEYLSPKDFVNKENLREANVGALYTICIKVIKNNEEAVEDYKNGREEALHFLIGQVMRETKGRADVQIVKGLMKKILKSMK